MHAVQIRSVITANEDTDLDPTRLPGQRRIRRRRRDRAPAQVGRSLSDREATHEKCRGERPRAGSLIDLHLAQTAGRRSARRFTTRLAQPVAREANSPVLVRIDWARADDADQSVYQVGADGVAIQTTASGSYGAGRRRGSSAAVPAVSIGIDGLIYSVPVHAGDSAMTTARRLAERLGSRFEVQLEQVSTDVSVLRLKSERIR